MTLVHGWHDENAYLGLTLNYFQDYGLTLNYFQDYGLTLNYF